MKLWWEGLVKHIDFKPGMKDGGVMDEESGGSTEEEVIDTGIGESRIEKLVCSVIFVLMYYLVFVSVLQILISFGFVLVFITSLLGRLF